MGYVRLKMSGLVVLTLREPFTLFCLSVSANQDPTA